MKTPNATRKSVFWQALLALEAKVKELGVNKIALHVFAHNHVARSLYEHAGFEITGIYMTKKPTR